jgi:hypothetical protein
MNYRSIHALMLLLVIILPTSIYGMYEKDKNLHDWRIESLGSLTDLKFIEDSALVYTLADNGVLALFDTNLQKVLWRKEMPVSESGE